jgi:hypothetical protein
MILAHDDAPGCTYVPSPHPSLGPLTGVCVRRNSSSVVDGSTPAASYRLPFTASTTVPFAATASPVSSSLLPAFKERQLQLAPLISCALLATPRL